MSKLLADSIARDILAARPSSPEAPTCARFGGMPGFALPGAKKRLRHPGPETPLAARTTLRNRCGTGLQHDDLTNTGGSPGSPRPAARLKKV
jgi:hypothetical protein